MAGTEVDAWREGIKEARRLARLVGMASDSDVSSSKVDSIMQTLLSLIIHSAGCSTLFG